VVGFGVGIGEAAVDGGVAVALMVAEGCAALGAGWAVDDDVPGVPVRWPVVGDDVAVAGDVLFGGGGVFGGAVAAGGAIPGGFPAPKASPTTVPGAGSTPATPEDAKLQLPPRRAVHRLQ
jgi:hypothetical protein